MNQSEIINCEERLREAMLGSNVEILNELIADDLIFISHTGDIMSKDADIEVHRSGNLKITEIKIKDQRIREMEKSVVTVTRVTISNTFGTESVAGEFWFTRVWEYRSGNWQVVSGHCSAVT